MVIAIALLVFNDLGRPVTPSFLYKNRYYWQLSLHCPKIKKFQGFCPRGMESCHLAGMFSPILGANVLEKIAWIGQFRIPQQQKNRVEVQGNNLHFPLFWTIQNANYSPEPRLCSFIAAQFETSLLNCHLKLKSCILAHNFFSVISTFRSSNGKCPSFSLLRNLIVYLHQNVLQNLAKRKKKNVAISYTSSSHCTLIKN